MKKCLKHPMFLYCCFRGAISVTFHVFKFTSTPRSLDGFKFMYVLGPNVT